MSKYTVITAQVEHQLQDNNALALFVRLFSGRYDDHDRDNLHVVFGMAKGTFKRSWKELVRLGYLIEGKEGWTVTDEPDALVNDSAIGVSLFESDNKLLKWLNEKCPRVQRMQKPITEKQAVELTEKFKTEQEKKALKETFEAMENFAQLHKKYVSAYLTVDNWVQSRIDKIPTVTSSSDYVPTV